MVSKMTLRSFDAMKTFYDSDQPQTEWNGRLCYVECVPAISRPRSVAPKLARRRALTDLRRAEIIAAALKVFAKKGFGSARAEDVAAQARIAKGTLYLYFDSKEAIYEAALAHAMAQLHTMVEDRLRAATTIAERIRAYVGTRLEFWGEQGELYRMVMTVGREKRQKKHTTEILRDSVERLLVILRDGIEHGELKARPVEMVGWTVMDMIRGATERRVDGLQATTVEADTATIVEIALRYFE
jgi:AcrR family transcriptional regulator